MLQFSRCNGVIVIDFMCSVLPLCNSNSSPKLSNLFEYSTVCKESKRYSPPCSQTIINSVRCNICPLPALTDIFTLSSRSI
ncbi:unnamed protein product [Amaranthus hypochondriacus]